MAVPVFTWLGTGVSVARRAASASNVDPLLSGKPKCPDARKSPERIYLIRSHTATRPYGDAVELGQRFGAPDRPGRSCARARLAWPSPTTSPTRRAGVTVTSMAQIHSHRRAHRRAPTTGRMPRGPPGCVFELEDGVTLYFRRRHDVFGDMALIPPQKIYGPDVAVNPESAITSLWGRANRRRTRAAGA